MKRFKTTVFFLFSMVFLFTACGMTQELDEALDTSKNLTQTLIAQKKLLGELATAVEKIQTSFDKDLETNPKTGLFIDKEGLLYKNFQLRQDTLSDLEDGQKEIVTTKKEFQRIYKKHAVDIDNDKLHLISNSLEIIDNNYDSLILYMNTGFEQEEELYTELPVDNLDDQLSMINRTYGSVSMVLEETITNINYTQNLVKNFESQVSTNTQQE